MKSLQALNLTSTHGPPDKIIPRLERLLNAGQCTNLAYIGLNENFYHVCRRITEGYVEIAIEELNQADLPSFTVFEQTLEVLCTTCGPQKDGSTLNYGHWV